MIAADGQAGRIRVDEGDGVGNGQFRRGQDDGLSGQPRREIKGAAGADLQPGLADHLEAAPGAG